MSKNILKNRRFYQKNVLKGEEYLQKEKRGIDNVSGVIVPPKKTKELADAIINLLNDNKKYKRLSEGAKKRYKEEFTKDKMVEKFENLYLEILK